MVTNDQRKKSSCFYMKFVMLLSVLYKTYLCEGSRGMFSSIRPWAEAEKQDIRPSSARAVGTLSSKFSPTQVVLYRDTASNK